MSLDRHRSGYYEEWELGMASYKSRALRNILNSQNEYRRSYYHPCGKSFTHSRKECWCGGHNTNNHKSNMLHSGTRRKHRIRQGRLMREGRLLCGVGT